MKSTVHIVKILHAMGASTTVTTDSLGNDIIHVNAPTIATEKSCETCARRATCKKEIGVIWGFCNTDYKKEDIKK